LYCGHQLETPAFHSFCKALHPTNMSTAIVLPNLTNWAKNHINAIYTATNATDFTSAINAFLSDKVVITVNGVQTSRADFVSQTQGEKFDEVGASVNYLGTVAVPSDPNQPINVTIQLSASFQ